MDIPDVITEESAQKLLRMAEELMVTRQALEHALQVQGEAELGGAKAALQSVVMLSDQVNETLRRWLEQERSQEETPH